MRSFLSLATLFAVGVVANRAFPLGPVSDDWRDYMWSYTPVITADGYAKLGREPPALAAPINRNGNLEEYVVKMECVGCPFLIRKRDMTREEWEKNPRDNSILLNFTIGQDKRSLWLNKHQVFPPTPLPVYINAYQIPANTSAPIMDKMVRMQLAGMEWNLGTLYGLWQLSYEHTAMAEDSTTVLFQFEVTHVEYNTVYSPNSAALNQTGQKMVQIRLTQDSLEGFKFKSIDLVDLSEKILSAKMPCGKDAPIVHTRFGATEWDYYGQKGTWLRTWHVVSWRTRDFFLDNIPLTVILSVIALGVWNVRRIALKQRREAAERLQEQMEDTQAALLKAEEGEFIDEKFDEKDLDVKDEDRPLLGNLDVKPESISKD